MILISTGRETPLKEIRVANGFILNLKYCMYYQF